MEVQIQINVKSSVSNSSNFQFLSYRFIFLMLLIQPKMVKFRSTKTWYEESKNLSHWGTTQMSLDMGMQLHQAGLVGRARLQLLTFDNNLR